MNKLLLFFFLCASCLSGFSQTKACEYPELMPFCIFPKEHTFSTIAGRVFDTQGAYITDACVALYDKEKKRVASMSTNDKGRFSIKGAPDGEYLLIIQSLSFTPAIEPVRINNASRIPGFLKISMVATGTDTCSHIKN